MRGVHGRRWRAGVCEARDTVVRLHHVSTSCACSICDYVVQTNWHPVSLHTTPPSTFNCMRGLTQMERGFSVFHVTCSRPTVQVIRRYHLVCALFRFLKPTRSILARPLYTACSTHSRRRHHRRFRVPVSIRNDEIHIMSKFYPRLGQTCHPWPCVFISSCPWVQHPCALCFNRLAASAGPLVDPVCCSMNHPLYQ